MYTDDASKKIREILKDLTELPPADCIQAAFTITGMLVGGVAFSYDLKEADVRTILKQGQQAMLNIIDRVRIDLEKDVQA